MKKMANNKAAGPDGTPAEYWKRLGENDAAVSIAREMYEMAEGAGLSRKMVFGALKALHGSRNTATRGKKMRGFIKRYERIIHILFDGFFFK